jgi:nucleosome assembly protein 1-like 1
MEYKSRALLALANRIDKSLLASSSQDDAFGKVKKLIQSMVEKLEKDAEDVDPPAVKDMKALDDQYLEIEREFEKEVRALRQKFAERQKPLLEQRSKILQGEDGDRKTGTPVVKGFWLEALGNHPAFDGCIEEWDAPVLEYLQDVTKVDLDPDDSSKGFKIRFQFAPNPYFEEAVLSKEYHTKEKSPYTGEVATSEIVASAITWKDGKDVTVEMVKKKVKGGGAKKEKQKGKAAKEEPRNSFFRIFFKTLKEDGPIPDDIDFEGMGLDDDEADEEAMMEMIMDNDHDMGIAIRDNIIPYAVRWYTGEAAPEMDDDDEADGSGI